ncbi:MAG: diguanylate cyclase [Butyrivibrio sp.]|nr:diguanylate cyclase [Butyrivibrio sp.]
MKKKAFYFLTIAFITFLFLVIACHYAFRPTGKPRLQKLTDGWTITTPKDTYTDVSLVVMPSRYNYSNESGDVISFKNTVTSDEHYAFPAIKFLSKNSAFEFYQDGALIESEFMSKFKKGEYIGTKYNFVTLKPFDKTTDIEIRLFINEDNTYSYEVPVFGDYTDVTLDFLFTNFFALSTAAFLIIFGMAFFIISLIFYKTLPDILSQLFSSLLFIDLGIWILCYFRLCDLFMNTWEHTTEIEYFSLYMMIPLMYMLIGCIQKHYLDWIFMVTSTTCAVICFFLFLMHVTGIVHVNLTLAYYQGISLLTILFLVVTIGRDIAQKKLQPAEKIQLLGLIVMSISFIVNFVFYMLEGYAIVPLNMMTKRATPMGGLAFVFATMLNYSTYITESYARRKEYASLAHLAYADGLTDLPNRSRYEKYMSDLVKRKTDYCVVSLDLNGLKEINDTRGHASGDNYLQEFAGVLHQCFDGKAFVARIGGDEFVAILTKDYWEEVETLITRLCDALEVKNVLYPEYRRSVATGYAFSTEISDADPHAVYLLADKRMYERKKRMHEKMGIKARI